MRRKNHLQTQNKKVIKTTIKATIKIRIRKTNKKGEAIKSFSFFEFNEWLDVLLTCYCSLVRDSFTPEGIANVFFSVFIVTVIPSGMPILG